MAGIPPGYLGTQGNQIVDAAGAAVRITGVNWFGLDGPGYAPEGLWVDSYQGHLNRMMDLGFNAVRLPWSDAMLEPGRIPSTIDYSLNPDLAGLTPLQIIDRIVDHAGQIGMRVILDHHRSGVGSGPNENGLWYTDQYPEATLIANWQMLAARYAGNPTVAGFDLHNEPHGPATWGTGAATDWDAAAERIGNAVLAVNPNALIIVEGGETVNGSWYWWGGNLTGVRAHPVDLAVPGKLVYSTHDYSPSMQPLPWFAAADFPNNMPAKWTEAWGHLFAGNTAPVLVGEFGTRLETAADQLWLGKFVQYLNGDLTGDGLSDLRAGEQGISWTFWSWNPTSWDTGGVLGADWMSVSHAKIDALKPAMYQDASAAPVVGAFGDTDDRFGGSRFDDVLMGMGGADTLSGGDGGDVLYGNLGNDALWGNLGADTLFGGQGGDAVRGGLGDDALYGNLAGDTLHGDDGADTLFGGQGDDVLYGGFGADALFGNLGNDALWGGAGADLFVLAGTSGADRVMDFRAAEGDRLRIAPAVQPAIGQGAEGAILDFGGGNRVTLVGVAANTVTADLFV
ncbi:MAG TPA: cellulase family glycosylhydrolase [Azospirillum sp.]